MNPYGASLCHSKPLLSHFLWPAVSLLSNNHSAAEQGIFIMEAKLCEKGAGANFLLFDVTDTADYGALVMTQTVSHVFIMTVPWH